MRGAKALCGAVNGRPFLDQPVTTQVTNMTPVFTVPETPTNYVPPSGPVFQAIPGQTYTPSTPGSQTVTPPAGIMPAIAPAAASAPWYQWFKEHPLYTGLIVLAAGGLIYWATKSNSKHGKRRS